tara:strand:- start:511 stop:969 length:459 start_codon:yes stop_codon:yes gene_type:complete
MANIITINKAGHRGTSVTKRFEEVEDFYNELSVYYKLKSTKGYELPLANILNINEYGQTITYEYVGDVFTYASLNNHDKAHLRHTIDKFETECRQLGLLVIEFDILKSLNGEFTFVDFEKCQFVGKEDERIKEYLHNKRIQIGIENEGTESE